MKSAGRPLPAGASSYLDLQPQDGAHFCGCVAQLQVLQLQSAHLQASALLFSIFVMGTSLVLVADKDLSKVRTMVRSQA